MKNLENLNLQELTIQEQVSTDAGFPWIAAFIAIIASNGISAGLSAYGDQITNLSEDDKKEVYAVFGSGF